MNQKSSLQVGHDGIAVVTLQNPPVNALHPAGVLQTLISHFVYSACLATEDDASSISQMLAII